MPSHHRSLFCCFFFNDTATTEIYTLSLHDALPIFPLRVICEMLGTPRDDARFLKELGDVMVGNSDPDYNPTSDRKSTRLNSSHANISYAVFCLKKHKHRTDVHGPINSSGLPVQTPI